MARPSPAGDGNAQQNGKLPPIVSNLAQELMQCKAMLAQAEQKLRDGPGGVPHTECIICMDAAVDTVLLPCGHLCLCNDCCGTLAAAAKAKGKSLMCPLCREPTNAQQRIYLHVEKPALPPIAAAPPRRVGMDASPAAGVASRRTPSARIATTARMPASGAFQPAHLENGGALISKSQFAQTLPASFQLQRDRIEF